MPNPTYRRFMKTLGLAVVVAMLLTQPVFALASNPDTLITRTVRTEAYTLDERGITVDGAVSSDVPGAPQLPVHAFIMELPVEGQWALSYEPIGEQLLDQHAVIPAVPVPQRPVDNQLSMDGQGDALPVIDQPDPVIYNTNAFYPESPVQWGEAERNGDKRILPVRVYPFQYNPVTGQLKYFREVRVSVRITDSRHSAPQKGIFQPDHDPFIPAAVGAVRIHTTQRGMHRLTYDDLNTAGVPVGVGGVDPNTFAVLVDGQPVSIKVTGNGNNVFEPGELVIFYAVPYTKRWQNFNVYWLTYGGAPSPAMDQRSVNQNDAEPLTTITQTLRVENQLYYGPNMPLRSTDDDHWVGDRLAANSTTPSVSVTYGITLDDPLTTGSIKLRGVFHRCNNQAAYNPDNSIALYLNNQYVNLYQWNGETDVEATVNETEPAAWLNGAYNELRFTTALSQLPGIPLINSCIDWIEVSYPAQADAEDNRFFIESLTPGTAPIQITGFTTNDLDNLGVYDVRDPQHPVQLLTRTLTPDGGAYTLKFWDANLPNPTYYVSSDSALLQPALVQIDSPSTWGTPDNHYDYIAIVPSVVEHGQTATDLANAVAPLLSYRGTTAGGGFRVATVNVQDIYDEFGYGRREPMAIREFLAYAYWNWNPEESTRPQYVLLVGDGTYDFIGATNTPMRNLIMPYLGDYDINFGEVPADNRYVSVDLDGTGHLDPDDYTPNMAIGRIPAQTVTEVSNAVSKTIGYETTAAGGDWQRRAIFSSGNCIDAGGDLQDSSDQIIDWLPSAYQATRIFYGDPTPGQCPNSTASSAAQFDVQARDAFNAGALYFQWFGHGSFIHWGGGPDFRKSDIDAMTPNTVFPMTAHYACATGYFTYLNGSTMDQAFGEDFLMRRPDGGSVVDLSGSGQHYAYSMVTLGRSMMKALFQDEIARAGLATDAGKMYYYAAATSFHDVLDTMLLFGDPAARLRMNDSLISGYTFQANPSWAPPGNTASYQLKIMNQTSWPAVNTQVTMTLPVELSAPLAMTATVSSPLYHSDTHEITWQPTVDPSSTVTLTFSSTLSPEIIACGSVTVSGQLVDPGNYQVTSFSDGIAVAVPDVDCSGDVDVADIQQVAAHWGSSTGNPDFHPRYDLDGDQSVTVLDMIVAAQAWD